MHSSALWIVCVETVAVGVGMYIVIHPALLPTVRSLCVSRGLYTKNTLFKHTLLHTFFIQITSVFFQLSALSTPPITRHYEAKEKNIYISRKELV